MGDDDDDDTRVGDGDDDTSVGDDELDKPNLDHDTSLGDVTSVGAKVRGAVTDDGDSGDGQEGTR